MHPFSLDWLVDEQFNGDTEFTISKEIRIEKDTQTGEAKLMVKMRNGHFVDLTLPDGPLPWNIRFSDLRICYIHHAVITFFLTNKHIFDKGTNLTLAIRTQIELCMTTVEQIWKAFVPNIWPIFVGNIHHLEFLGDDVLPNLRRSVSPTILTDLKLLKSIDSGRLLPDLVADDGPNATAAKALTKWLRTPTPDGRPKRLRCRNEDVPMKNLMDGWIEKFRSSKTPACYVIQLGISTSPFEAFEWANRATHEKLTLTKEETFRGPYKNHWLLKRCPKEKTVQWEDKTLDNLNGVWFNLRGDCVGPLSPTKKKSAGNNRLMNAMGPSVSSADE